METPSHKMVGLDPRRTDYSDVHIMEEPERVVPREAWNAVDPDFQLPLANPVSYLVFTFTRTPICDNAFRCYETVFNLQKDAVLEKKLVDIPYNFIVGGTGFVYEGRGWATQPTLPPHLSFLEDKALYIGVVGDKESIDKDEEMVQEISDAVRGLIRYGMDHQHITKRILKYNISWDKSHLLS